MHFGVVEIGASGVFHNCDKLFGLISVMWTLMSQPAIDGRTACAIASSLECYRQLVLRTTSQKAALDVLARVLEACLGKVPSFFVFFLYLYSGI